uniref:Uncharacterized protein n=1 Tax=Verrucosispora sp. MS100047 TaxID=1410949 RepID=A0A097CRQ8_9ACTN|nr:hypothetical protein VASRM7_91 [Verrucosispora sp. MS100047]
MLWPMPELAPMTIATRMLSTCSFVELLSAPGDSDESI